MTATLEIHHANVHNKKSGADKAMGGSDAAAILESQTLDYLRTLPLRRQTVAGSGWEEERNRAKSTCIVTRRDLNNIGEVTRLASEGLPAFEMVAPDRVSVWSCFEHPIAKGIADGIAFGVLHPDAGPEALKGKTDAGPNHPIVREYGEAWTTHKRIAKMLRADGLIIVITSDAQMPRSLDVPWNPARTVARPLNLEVETVHIDWLMYDRRLRLAKWNTFDLFDHTGFRAQFEPAKRGA